MTRNTPGMMSKGRGALVLLVSAVCWGIAGSATATTQYFSELITSEDSVFLPSDVSMTLTGDSFVGLGTIINDGVLNGSGVGDGYVGTNDVIAYNHTFTAPSNATIIGASLTIATIDDQWWDWNESVAIGVGGTGWASGSALLAIFSDTIAAGLFEVDGQLQVTIMATRGDFNLVGSLLQVAYDVPDTTLTNTAGSGVVNAVPEPGAIALFCTGIVLFGALRRRMFGSGPS